MMGSRADLEVIDIANFILVYVLYELENADEGFDCS